MEPFDNTAMTAIAKRKPPITADQLSVVPIPQVIRRQTPGYAHMIALKIIEAMQTSMAVRVPLHGRPKANLRGHIQKAVVAIDDATRGAVRTASSEPDALLFWIDDKAYNQQRVLKPGTPPARRCRLCGRPGHTKRACTQRFEESA